VGSEIQVHNWDVREELKCKHDQMLIIPIDTIMSNTEEKSERRFLLNTIKIFIVLYSAMLI